MKYQWNWNTTTKKKPIWTFSSENSVLIFFITVPCMFQNCLELFSSDSTLLNAAQNLSYSGLK